MDEAKKKSSFNLKSAFVPAGDQPAAIKTLIEGYQAGKQFQTLLGVTGSGKTFTMANVIQSLNKKVLVMAHNKTLAAQLYSEFKEFFPDNRVEYFVSYYDYYQPEAYVPGSDTYIEKDSAINEEIDKLRHGATQSLIERDDVIVVSSVSCIYGLGSPSEYEAQKCTLFQGESVGRDALLRQLVDIQFTRNDMDFHRGVFRVRGDVVEVFPAHEAEKAIRIEFFGDEIDRMSIFDPLTGKDFFSVHQVTIYPKSHYVVNEENLKKALEAIKLELREQLMAFETNGKLVEKQRLEQRTMLDIEMMEEIGHCPGIENYSRHLMGGRPGEPPYTLIDFFKKDFLLIIDESHMSVPQVGGMFRGDRARKTNLVNYGFRLPSALDNRPLTFEEFEKKYAQVLFVSATPADYELKQCGGEVVEQLIRPTGLLDPVIEFRPAKTQVEDVLGESKKVIKSGMRVLITTLTKKLAEDLSKYFESAGIKVRYLHSDIDTLERVEIIRDLRLGIYDVLIGINLIREGLDIPEVGLVGILDADKEGFLRSTRSLIQTIGRAARNSEGRVILYGHRRTPNIVQAMHETERRRKIQMDYNTRHGITPQTIVKEIKGGIIETLRGKESDQKNRKVKGLHAQTPVQNEHELDQRISELKRLMHQASQELRFEEAAKFRDEIKILTSVKIFL
ncbi:MAG: excinuclease ABC subunit B [Bdellovibrionales bacterium GWA2_49_15]|nr:MAG: excinuclease ABC subunit B [Bdellovibrionales bacterium GWA2_49_15]HAZ12433.1 excinuclease ABC subunit B [Bdellovibrionales bacterium]